MEHESEYLLQSYQPPLISLVRTATSADFGTTGILLYGDPDTGREVAKTLECYYNEGRNLPYYDCIPEGTYQVVYTWSPKFRRDLFLLLDVPGRSGIRIHPASYAAHKATYGKEGISDLEGCIAVGLDILPRVDSKIKYPTKYLSYSKDSVEKFERAMNWRGFELKIVNRF